MKPITWIQLFILCAGIGQAWAVKAQDVRFLSQEKIDSLINPPLMKQRDEILRFEKTVQDIGILTEDDAPRACSFTYTNVSKAPVVIIRVRTTCGCTAADAYTKSTSGRNANHHADLPPEKSSRNDRYEHFRLSIFFG